MAMRYAFEHPERVSALVLYASGARNVSAPDYDLQIDRATVRSGPTALRRALGRPRRRPPVSDPRTEQGRRPRVSGMVCRVATAELQPRQVSRNRDVGPRRRRPRHPERDQRPDAGATPHRRHVLPVANGRYLADHIPGAQFVELDGNDHLPFVGDSDAIADAIEAFVAGRITRRRRATHVVPVSLRQHGVTRREFEVLDLVASGATNQAIADDLHISVRTVESHISSLFTKLGSDNRAALDCNRHHEPEHVIKSRRVPHRGHNAKGCRPGSCSCHSASVRSRPATEHAARTQSSGTRLQSAAAPSAPST